MEVAAPADGPATSPPPALEDDSGKNPISQEVTKVADLSYYQGEDADPEKHKLDLYLPAGAKNFRTSTRLSTTTSILRNLVSLAKRFTSRRVRAPFMLIGRVISVRTTTHCALSPQRVSTSIQVSIRLFYRARSRPQSQCGSRHHSMACWKCR